jgi:Tol biopolymer transport system component
VSIDLKRFRRESGRQSVSRITAARPAMQAAPSPSSHEMEAAAPAPTPAKRAIVPWIVAAAAIVLAGATLFLYQRASNRVAPLYMAAIQPPPGSEFLLQDGGHMALSPDGTTLTFTVIDTSGKTSLWVRKLDSNVPRQLLETDGAEYPFWSPDSRFIGFFVPGKMKKVLASGGPPFVVCDAPSGRGGSWNTDDVIIFSPRFDRTGIDRVAAGGGPVTHVTEVDSARNMSNARWPHFLPDGKHFIYTTQAAKRSSDFTGGVYAASLDGSVDKHLLDLSTNVEYRDGKLLYVRQDALVMQEFDPGTLELSGDAIPVVNKIGYAPNRSKGVFSSSLGGVMIYMTVSSQGRTLSWIDRQQNLLVPAGNVVIDAAAYLAADDSRILYDSYDPIARNFDIWALDIARGLKSRLTFDQADDSAPILSPDGSRFVYTSWKEGVNIFVKSMAGTDTPELLVRSITSALPTDWSRDGRYLLFQDVEQTAAWDIWYVSLDGDRAKKPFVKTEFSEAAAVFSPDGRWVAYESDESSRNEIYVRPFPPGDGKWQVSTGGGRTPIWDKTGLMIYYNTDQGVMGTAVNGAGTPFTIGESKLVLRNPAQAGLLLHGVTADGKKILVSHLPTNQGTMPLTLVTDWRRTTEGR